MNHLKLITSLVVVLLFRLSHKTSNKTIKDNFEQQGFFVAFNSDIKNSNLTNNLLKLLLPTFGSCYLYNTFTGKNNNTPGLRGGDSRCFHQSNVSY